MGRKFLVFLIIFGLIATCLLKVNTPAVDAVSTTTTFTAGWNTAFLERWGTNYTAVHDDADALNKETFWLEVGQTKSGSTYYVKRSFVYFDTSSIPDSATIQTVELKLVFLTDYSTDDFKIVIRNGQPDYPTSPTMQYSDFDYTFYTGNGGELDTNGISLYTPYSINMTELSWVNKTSTTKLALISSKDVASTTPTQNEYVLLASSEDASPANKPKLTVTYEYYQYTLKGLYDEASGDWLTTGVNVTAYFVGNSSTTFEVNGTYEYTPSSIPLYFHFELGSLDREYWLSTSETDATIYIFNASTTTYTISFLDLAGVLNDNPYVSAKRYVNGTLRTVEKCKVDVENKVVMNLVNGAKYTLTIQDGASYTYGDLTMTSTTTIQLTLKGTDFPKETLLTSKYVRIYGERVFGTPNGNITITYEDLLNLTNAVEIYINYKNGTNAYNATESSSSFVHTWTSALNNTDYIVEANIYHEQYGSWIWRQYFPRSMSTAPWGLDFLGTSLPFATSILIPAFLILFVGGCFSVINAEVGAFMMVVVAATLTYLGWISIAPGALITAISLSILMGIIYAKRRVQT